MLPNFRYEKYIWNSGYDIVAGIDEVGRGAFAGPVVAGCVVLKSHTPYPVSHVRIDDSKRLSPKQREIANLWIRENALTWGVGEATASEIDRLGIVKATNRAIRRAIGKANQRLHNRIQYILIDAFYIPYVRGIRMPLKSQRKNRKTEKNKNKSRKNGCQTAIIKGDQKSFSIAGASIIAKVYRDNLMINLNKRKKYRKYQWDKNKGYGTKKHRNILSKYGLTDYHRKSYFNVEN